MAHRSEEGQDGGTGQSGTGALVSDPFPGGVALRQTAPAGAPEFCIHLCPKIFPESPLCARYLGGQRNH